MSFRQELNKIALIIKLSRQAFGEFRLSIAVLIALGFVGGLLGGIGINALVPLFTFVAGGDRSDDIITQYIEKVFDMLPFAFNVKNLLILIIFLFFLKAFVLIISSFISVLVTSGYEERTRNKLFRSILGADWSYLLQEKLGHLGTVLSTNIEFSKNLFTQVSLIILSLTSMIVYAMIAFNISATMTLLSFALGITLFIPFRFLTRQVKKVSYESEKINRDASHFINENILGMKTIKIMSVGEKILNIGSGYFRNIKRISIKSYLLGIPTGPFVEPVSIIFIAFVFAISYKFFGFNLASLIAILYLVKQIFLYIVQIQKQLLGMNSTIPYLMKVLEYETQSQNSQEKNMGTDSFNFNNELELKNLSFSYSNGSEVLSDLNLKVKRGEMIGLIGGSGEGKTTITDLILRLFSPNKGEILLDGKNISRIDLNEWRENIGYVSQDIFLKNDTLENNIKFYNSDVSTEDMEKASKMANIYDYIKSLPKGFQTEVGERGVLLSGGQKQRIILARVLAKNPKILILDEATSALDNKSEKDIQEAINKIKGEITILVIAHRLSTVMSADKLLVLDKGKIVEQGTPKELLKDEESRFSKLYNLR